MSYTEQQVSNGVNCLGYCTKKNQPFIVYSSPTNVKRYEQYLDGKIFGL